MEKLFCLRIVFIGGVSIFFERHNYVKRNVKKLPQKVSDQKCLEKVLETFSLS